MLSLSNLFHRSRSASESAHSKPHARGTFELGKDKDGIYFADPKDLTGIDWHAERQAAADEVNRNLALLARVREAVLPLDGTEFDNNPQEGIVAVKDFSLDGKTVDAALAPTSYKGFPKVQARICENGKTVTLIEDFGYQYQDKVAPERTLSFDLGQRVLSFVDFNYLSDKASTVLLKIK